MKRVAFACLISCLSLTLRQAPAQEGGLAVRIETTQEGLHRVPADLIKAHFSLDRIDPERLALTHDGQPVAIEVFGASDGHFDPADEVVFFADAPKKRHSSTETYVLRDRGTALRLRKGDPASGSAEPLVEVQVVGRSAPGLVFDALPTVRQDVVRGPALSPWFLVSLSPKGARPRNGAAGSDPTAAVVPMILDPRPMKGLPARLRVRLRGAVANGVEQQLGINVNGTDLAVQTWDTPLQKELIATVPPDVLRRETSVRLTNLSEVPSYTEPGNELSQRRRNDLLIERVEIFYDAAIVGPSVSGHQTILRLPPLESGAKTRVLRVESRAQDPYLIVEPRSGRLWRASTIEIPGDREVTLSVSGNRGAYLPEDRAVHPMRPTREHLSSTGGDYVIVTTTDLKPAVDMLADHRRADGFTPVVVEARELYDAFTHGAFHPAAIQRFLTAANANWAKKPRYLLIVGDADLDANWLNQRETIPAWMVMTDYNGFTATDSLHADVDGDGLADIPVGRLPVRTRQDLLAVAGRIVALETAPPPGAWRHTLAFVAGEGRFGAMVDKMLESEAAKSLSAIPAKFDVRMTYGSPKSLWYWPADDFNAHLIRTFNAGALAFTYIGHGSPEAFDHVTVGSTSYPILAASDIAGLDSQGRSPVMTIIACSTGRYDDPKRDCLAEQMLLKNGGPIAVIAASRISHPYPNALLGEGVARTFFSENNRVGDAFLAGTRAMVAGSKGPRAFLANQFLSKAIDGPTLVRDHAAIYNLFGDPAQKLPFPADIAAIEAPDVAKPGATVEIKATLPEGASGEASVSIEARRDKKLKSGHAESGPVNASSESDSATRAEAVKARHALANDHAVAGGRFKIADGAVSASLPLPADLSPGDYTIVIFLEGDAKSPVAFGSKKLKVE